MTTLQKHCRNMESIIAKTHNDDDRLTLEAAYGLLCKAERADSRNRRNPKSWPICPKCGKPFQARSTSCDYVDLLMPACGCATNDVAWGTRGMVP